MPNVLNGQKGIVMGTLEDRISKITTTVCSNQLKLYMQIARRQLTSAGISETLVDSSLKAAANELMANQEFQAESNRLISGISKQPPSKENRGIDSIGRILIEFCFFRVPQTKMIWPEGSEQDNKARKEFIEGITPRPLMRYFLVSVRGSIPQLNKFEAASVLFGEENTTHEERKQYVDDIIKEFVIPDISGSRTVNWNHVYADKRFQQVALELIGDIRRKMEQFGLERYLRILENLRQRDPDRKDSNSMERPFVIEDARQIDSALWAAEEALARIVD